MNYLPIDPDEPLDKREPRIEVDMEVDELGRYYHALCKTCGDFRAFDSEDDVVSYQIEHECEVSA